VKFSVDEQIICDASYDDKIYQVIQYNDTNWRTFEDFSQLGGDRFGGSSN